MDLQPKPTNITLKGNSYLCKAPRLSHRLIIARVQPLFEAASNVATGAKNTLTAEDTLSLEKDLDALIGDLIPTLNNVTLDIIDLAELVAQIMEIMLPEESKALKEAKVEIDSNKDPKEEANKEKIG